MAHMAGERSSGVKPVEPGPALKAARLAKGWTLAELAGKTGFSISTLSKIENGRSGLSYTKMMKLGQNMGIDIADLLSGGAPRLAPGPVAVPASGRIARGARAITRAGAETRVEDETYIHACPAAELLRRSLHPMITEVKARSIEEFGELRAHPGEEFTYVLEGAVDLHTDQYAPTRMNVGDSVYFDAGMGHAWVAASEGPCRILSVFSASLP